METRTALEATQGQNNSFFSQLPHKCYLEGGRLTQYLPPGCLQGGESAATESAGGHGEHVALQELNTILWRAASLLDAAKVPPNPLLLANNLIEKHPGKGVVSPTLLPTVGRRAPRRKCFAPSSREWMGSASE